MTPSEAIDRLSRAGMTEHEIGSAVGARQSTINRIRRGEMRPNWDIGQALVALAEATPEPEQASDSTEAA